MKPTHAQLAELERRATAYVSEIVGFIEQTRILRARPTLPPLSDGAMNLDLALRELRAEVKSRPSPMPSIQEHLQYLGELRQRITSDRIAFEECDAAYPLVQILGELESLVIAIEQLSGIFPGS